LKDGRPGDAGKAGIPQNSLLARFIFQSGNYRKLAPAKPKPNAFLPDPSKLKCSAIWRDTLPEQEIWQIGDSLGAVRSKPPLARADFNVAAVSEAKLAIEPDPEPHPLHINLCGWPIGKDEQKAIALLLCV
jgi:hypothetical protein